MEFQRFNFIVFALLAAIGLLALAAVIIREPEPDGYVTPTAATHTVTAVSAPIAVDDLLALTNQQRQKAGMPPVQLSIGLTQSATEKCLDMADRKYWSHDTPTERWFEVIEKYNDAKHYGENLAHGYFTANGVINGWVNSDAHYQNMINDWTHVGFGVCQAVDYQNRPQSTIVVQHFYK